MKRENATDRTRHTAGSLSNVEVGGIQVAIWLPDNARIGSIVKPSDALIAEMLAESRFARVLEIGSRTGVVGRLARVSGWCEEVHWVATNRWTARVLEQSTVVEGTRFVLGESPLDAPEGQYDAVVIHQQPSRELTEHWLRQAAARISDDGTLLLAGAINEGVKVAASSLEEVCERVEVRGLARGHRVVEGRKPIIRTPEPLPVSEHATDVNGTPLRWTTVPGVFHAEGIDAATALLLETVVLPKKGRILDIGCGAGIIGLTCALRAPGCTVTMTDDSVAAANRTREGIALNAVENARVVLSDRLSDLEGERFDVVVTNPPVHYAGKTDTQLPVRFVEDAARAVGRKGRLWMVTSPTIPVLRPMKELFTEVTIAADIGSFRVYDAIRRPPRHVR